jgi:putative SOS response-associated peptidase YedK
MCARYTLTIVDDKFIAIYFQLNTVPELIPRYNIAPSQKVPVIGVKSDGITRGWNELTWGFVPHWAQTPSDGPRPVNARSETVRTSAPFRDSFRTRRCLIPADGYYEWLTEGKAKKPYRMTPSSGGVIAFAGIWDVSKSPGLPSVFTCAILTVPANESMNRFHDRMPAILNPDQFTDWLKPSTKPDVAHAMLQSPPEEALVSTAVTPFVNKAGNEGPECIKPVE